MLELGGALVLVILAVGLVLVRRRTVLRRARVQSPERRTYSELEREVLGAPPQLPRLRSGDDLPNAANTAVLAPPTKKRMDAGRTEEGPAWGAAAADGAVPALQYAVTWAQVDDHVFDAVAHMTHESVTSIADLGKVIKEHDWAAGSLFGPKLGLLREVKGHVAEFLARDHLDLAGHEVLMPPMANNPGFDLTVDGHALNVKAWQDAAHALRSHLSAHEGIPILLPHDATGIPDDAVHFSPEHGIDLAAAKEAGALAFVDDALSNADAADIAQNGLEAAAGHVPLHVPWITIAVSGFREVKLLTKGHTELKRAAWNVTVDAGTVGLGGAAGAKGGAAIGTLIAPGIGTLIGAVVGGIGGAFAGRKVANAVKQGPLDDARTEYERAATNFEDKRTSVVAEAETEWSQFEAAQRSALSARAAEIETHARSEVGALRESLDRQQMLTNQEATTVLDAARGELLMAVENARAAEAALPLWRRVWPDERAAEVMTAAEHAPLRLDEFEQQSKGVLNGRDHVSAEEVFDVALLASGAEQAARTHLTAVGVRRGQVLVQAERVVGEAAGRMLVERRKCADVMKKKRAETLKGIEAALERSLRRLRKARDELVSELRRNGVEVPV